MLEAPETELQQNEIVVQTAQPLELEASAQETMHKLLSQTSPELPQDLSQAVANTYNGHTYARFDEVMTWGRSRSLLREGRRSSRNYYQQGRTAGNCADVFRCTIFCILAWCYR